MSRPTWRKALSEVYACDEGIAALAEVVGDLDAPMPCSWAWALAVLSSPGLPTAPHVGWGIGRLVDPCDVGVVAGADLRSAQLAGANLAGANLAGANLYGAYLYGAYLADACLAGAYLADAALRDADLRGANLAGANLAGANLAGANLAWASLAGATLWSADLSGADLRGANLTGAWRDSSDPSIVGWVVVDGRLRRATP